MIKLFVGPMFSNKTESLLQEITKATYAKREMLVFNSVLDNRYTLDEKIVSHTGKAIPAVKIAHIRGVLEHVSRKVVPVTHIYIDEVMLIQGDPVPVFEELDQKGIKVYASALDLDSAGKPFLDVGRLMCYAHEVVKLTAVCVDCYEDATRTERLTGSRERIFIGEKKDYAAKCQKCFRPSTYV